jgi:tetratricopeptide (TPR) repeat protein
VAPNDPRRTTVCQNFEKNLNKIIEIGRRSGSRVVLNTVGSNLKDCSPFASLQTSDLAPEDGAKVDTALKAASAAQTQGDFALASAQYSLAAKAFPQAADVQFLLAGCLLKATNYSAALEHFQSAADCDTRPFRAQTLVNRIIGETGRHNASHDLVLVDAFSVLNTNCPAGIAGNELFLDHNNLNFEGNYLLARVWAEAIAPGLPAVFTNHATAEWPSQAVCDQRLCLTDWNRAAVLDKALAGLSDPSFAGQPNHAERVSWMYTQLAAVKERLHPREFIDARFACEQAIKKRPQDYWRHQKFGEFLEANNDLPGATVEWERVRDLLPFLSGPCYQVGRLLAAQGKFEEAQAALLRAVTLRPDFAEAWIGLGKVSLVQRKVDVALKRFERAKEVSPGNFWAYYHTGLALTRLDRNAEAIPNFRQAIALGPKTFLEAHLALGEALVLEGDSEQAATEFKQVIRLKPDLPVAHFNLGLVLLKLGQTGPAIAEFKETLRLDPQNQSAKDAISKILAAQP